jgi:hypothetical protein
MSDCQDYGPLAFAALDEVVPTRFPSNARTLVVFGLAEEQARSRLPIALERSRGNRKRRAALRAYPLSDGEEIPRLIERELAEGKRDFSRRGYRVPCYVIACPRGARVVDGRLRTLASGRAGATGLPAWAAIVDALRAESAAVLLDAEELSSSAGRHAVRQLQGGLPVTLWDEPRELPRAGSREPMVSPDSEVFPTLLWMIEEFGRRPAVVGVLARNLDSANLLNLGLQSRGFGEDGKALTPEASGFCHLTLVSERSGPFGLDRAVAACAGRSPITDNDSLRAIVRTVTEQTWVRAELEDSGGFIRKGLPRDFVPRRLGDVCKVLLADEVDPEMIEKGNVVWLEVRGENAGAPTIVGKEGVGLEFKEQSVALITKDPLFLFGCLLDARFLIQVRERAGGTRNNPISSREHVEECDVPWVDSAVRRAEMLRQLDELKDSVLGTWGDSFVEGILGWWFDVVSRVGRRETVTADFSFPSLIDTWNAFPRYRRALAELWGRSAVDSGLESPAPLAFLERRRLVERDPRAQIRHVRDLYETAVRLDCLVLFAALRSAAINSRFEDIMQTVTRPVLDAGRRSPTAFRPAIGTWLQCASALRRFIAGDRLLAESMRVGFDIARSVDVGHAQRLSDSIVAARNADSHSVARSVSEAFLQVDDASEWYTDIHQVYRYLWRLEWYVSVGLEEDGADRPILKVDVAHGSDPLWRGERLRIGETQAVDALTPGRVVLRSARGDELLSLHPFVQCHPARGEGHDLWMLAQIVDGHASLNCVREGAAKQESRVPMPGFGWLAR